MEQYSNTEKIAKILSEEFKIDVNEFFIVARSKSGDDIKYTYRGSALTLAGLASWFSQFISTEGFRKSLYRKEDDSSSNHLMN